MPSQHDVPLTLPDVVNDPVMVTEAQVKNTVKKDTMVADRKTMKVRGVPLAGVLSPKVLMGHRNASPHVVHGIVRDEVRVMRTSFRILKKTPQ